jgi:NAD(P)-dependent dehydrogenase (short-subunit alcohol dehydrogenase family)
MTSLDGRVAIITGGSGNLGQATVRAFLEAGANTVAVDRSVERAERLYGGREVTPERLLIRGADVTDADDVDALIADVKAHFGRIDVLVNTVGTYRGSKPVHEEDPGLWDSLFKVNVKTALLTSRAVIPHMLEQGSGKIINVASRNALAGTGKVGAYSATKSAVMRLTESVAQEVKASGISANCVLPGTIDTPQNREAMPDADFGKWVTPEAIADVIVFLASEAARGITGAAIPVYGKG